MLETFRVFLMNWERVNFYFIDFDGNVYHDTRPVTDPGFLDLLYSRLQLNTTGFYENFPYVSPLGKEMNFIACPDTPVVFHTFHEEKLYFAGNLSIEFQPENLYYVKTSSLFYHHWKEKLFGRPGKLILEAIAGDITAHDGKYFFRGIPVKMVETFQDLIFTKKPRFFIPRKS